MPNESTTGNDKRPRTEAQIAASRSNGAKSKGPTSPEGKSAICHNRMIHGFRSGSIVLRSEDSQAYDSHLDAYLARYHPVDKTEQDLVGLLASTMWQVMRMNSIEVALFEIEISGVRETIEGQFEDMDEYGRLALAFRKSAGDNSLELLRRYKSTAERAYHRALQAIEEIQRHRRLPPAEDCSAVQTQDPAAPENAIPDPDGRHGFHQPVAMPAPPTAPLSSEDSNWRDLVDPRAVPDEPAIVTGE